MYVHCTYIHTYLVGTNLVQHNSFEDVQFCMYYVRSTLNVIGMFHVCNGNQILLIVEPYLITDKKIYNGASVLVIDTLMFHAIHSKYVRNRTNNQIVKQCSFLFHVRTDVPGTYMVRTVPTGK